MRKMLVIGAVALGPKAACRAKRLNPSAEITMIDQDEFISYGGCGIPYYISGEVSSIEALRSTTAHAIRDPKFFEDMKGVNVKTKTKALAINREEKTVLVQDLNTGKEEKLAYDKLVIATGASPRPLTVSGADLQGITPVTNLHHAASVYNKCARGKVTKAVIMQCMKLQILNQNLT